MQMYPILQTYSKSRWNWAFTKRRPFRVTQTTMQPQPGADYGLGTIGTCLGPPPARGPPFGQKRKKIPMTTMGPLYNIPYFLQIKIKKWIMGPLKNLFLLEVCPPPHNKGPPTRLCLGAPKGVNPPLVPIFQNVYKLIEIISMVLGKIPVNLKQKRWYATRQRVFLSQLSEMQVLNWSTG